MADVKIADDLAELHYNCTHLTPDTPHSALAIAALIERVSRAEAERDAVAEILGTLAPGGSIVNMAEAARNVMDAMKLHRDAAVADEKNACDKALAALSGAGITTPEETYGSNSGWAISDLCRAVTSLSQQLAKRDYEIELIVDWCNAYPVDLFPDPDMNHVLNLLGDSLLTQLGAYHVRYVLNALNRILVRTMGNKE